MFTNKCIMHHLWVSTGSMMVIMMYTNKVKSCVRLCCCHLSEEAFDVLWTQSESIPYHLRVIDRGQVEFEEWDVEAFQLSNQQQQNHTISKLDRKKHTGCWNTSMEGDLISGEVIGQSIFITGCTTGTAVPTIGLYLFVHISHLQTHRCHILVHKM